MRQKTKNEIRCFCRRQPLLATFGVDEKSRGYVHVKVFKNRRIFGEILITRGDIQLRCRECMRWYSLSMRGTMQPVLVETPEPDSLSDEASSGHV